MIASVMLLLDRKTTQLNQKQINGLAFHLIFHHFSPFSCCLSVFCGIIPIICRLCLVLIKRFLLDHLTFMCLEKI